MTYRVVVTPTAAKELKKLGPKVLSRIRAALVGMAEEPRPPGVVKLAISKNDWRIRVGDYRILYEIDDPSNQVTVWRIAHRGKAYRRM